jgi:uncharacterized cupredoxin-like copper-binding protein
VLRNALLLIAAAMLSLTVLAACGNGDDDDAANGDEEETTEVTDETESDTEDESDEMGAARTGDEDEPDPAGQTGGSAADEGTERSSEQLDVKLVDHEIEMPDTAASGIVSFIITNEGEEEHGISVTPADAGNGSDEDSVLGTMYVEPGDDQQLEIELEAGEYTVFCPVGDHREEHGMETTLTVE